MKEDEKGGREGWMRKDDEGERRGTKGNKAEIEIEERGKRHL